MPYSEAQNKATQRYMKKTYKRISVDVRKPDAERWKAAADSVNESVVGFIKKAVEARIAEIGGTNTN